MESKFRVWRVGVQVLLLIGVVLSARIARADDVPVPSLWYSPLEINFGSVPIGSRVQRQIDVQNLGTAPLTLSGGQVNQPFSIDFDSCGGAVAPNATCRVLFSFAPTTPGDYTAESGGDSNAGPWGVVLYGRTASPEIRVSPRSLDFGRGPVGSDFPAQVVVVTNIGSVSVGGFAAQPLDVPFTGGLGQCANRLQPGQTCHMTFDFVPANPGVYRKVWNVQSEAGSFAIELQGRTYSGIDGTGQGVTPRAIDFGPVRLDETVREKITFRNFDPSIPIVNWEYSWISDQPVIDFDYDTNCGESLAGLNECEVTVSYRPRHLGEDHVILNVLNSQGIIDIHLWGSGAASDIVVDSPAIDLGMGPGGPGNAQVVRFTNLGHGPADVLGVQGAPSFVVTDSDCGETLAAGQTCTAAVRFQPQGYGRREEAITLLTGSETVPVRVLGGLLTPNLSVAIRPAEVTVGDLLTLRLTFANANPAQALFELGMAGDLPDGLVVIGGLPEASPACGEPAYTALPNGAAFALEDGTLAGGQTCIIELAARAVLAGDWRFEGVAISHAGPSAAASDAVTVREAATETRFRLFVPSLISPPSS